jgi:hypothetical protein
MLANNWSTTAVALKKKPPEGGFSILRSACARQATDQKK